MRETGPWGLDPNWLEPGKIVTDPVHGDIHLLELEVAVIDSRAFQRLRRVKQLGTTHLVYPGATHTRFSHSLGAVKVAQDLVDTVVDQRSGLDPAHDLFMDWEQELRDTPSNDRGRLTEDGAAELDKRVAEVTVLARLGALLHDLCHVPFGHSIEDDLEILTPHDENKDRFDRHWSSMPNEVRAALEGADDLMPNLLRLILSKRRDLADAKYPFVDDIVGNTICADLLDYLRRDHLFTGLPLALGTRFTSGYYVMPEGDPLYAKRMVLRVHRGGDERRDAITEIIKHLRYRYELSERVLVHKTKLAADAMMGKALEIWRDGLWAEAVADDLYGAGPHDGHWPDGTTLETLRTGLLRVALSETEDATIRTALADAVRNQDDSSLRALLYAPYDAAVREYLESVLSAHGDDGLLELLCDLTNARRSTDHCDEDRRRAVEALATGLRDHQLYKRIAIQRHVRGDRESFCEKFAHPDQRRRIERNAARFAGVSPAWKILVWLPSPKMRLKVADVIVDDGIEIRKFVDREREGRRREAEIYEAHEHLWGVSVFVHKDVYRDEIQKTRVLASLSADLDIQLGGLGTSLGRAPSEWPDRLVLRDVRVGEDRHVPTDAEADSFIARRKRQLAARRASADQPTYTELAALYQAIADRV